MEIRYYASEAGRIPARDFLLSLELDQAQMIRADFFELSVHGDKAPISKRPIKGHRPMWEVRTGRYRSFFVRIAETYWILGICKKQDQEREIAAAAKRMKDLLGR